MLKEYQRDYGIQALMTELNKYLGRDYDDINAIKTKGENGVKTGLNLLSNENNKEGVNEIQALA